MLQATALKRSLEWLVLTVWYLPERVGGAHMATLVAQPDIVEFLEHLTLHSDTPTQLMEIACHELPEGNEKQTYQGVCYSKKIRSQYYWHENSPGRINNESFT